MHIVSINSAKSAAKNSGIDKQPMERQQAFVGIQGLVADTIVNKKFHGGAYQALYVYSQEDLDYWSGVLGRNFSPGNFGENILLMDFSVVEFRIGDIVQLGEVYARITYPRIPCSVFAKHIGQDHRVGDFCQSFLESGRTGFYLKILETGFMRLGDSLILHQQDLAMPSISSVAALYGAKIKDKSLIELMLKSAIAPKMRSTLEAWLGVQKASRI